jgi:predicted membrane metal-binding protein
MATVLEPSLAPTAAPESSDRSFGLVFAAVFAIIGAWPLFHRAAPRWWAFLIAVAFVLVALVQPGVLRPLNQAWQLFGRLLHQVASPLVMSAIFFLAVTPTAWIMRWRGIDVLKLRRRPDLSSYWIARAPDVPETEAMKRQF